jgi:hypothetical protein
VRGNEQPLDLLEKAPPERRDRVMVGWSFAAMKRNVTESYVARSSFRLENTPVAYPYTRSPAAARDDTKPILSPGSSGSSPREPTGQ